MSERSLGYNLKSNQMRCLLNKMMDMSKWSKTTESSESGITRMADAFQVRIWI